eukprot:Gb_17938 [translate_table: standard]
MEDGDRKKGLLWKLPLVESRDLGKIGPGLGYGIGCGFGFGVGLFGGAGLGIGVPGVQLGVGIGAGCGVGLGFGYGVGRGWAYDENGRYSNVGRLFRRRRTGSTKDEIGAMLDDLISSTRQVCDVINREIEKRRR